MQRLETPKSYWLMPYGASRSVQFKDPGQILSSHFCCPVWVQTLVWWFHFTVLVVISGKMFLNTSLV